MPGSLMASAEPGSTPQPAVRRILAGLRSAPARATMLLIVVVAWGWILRAQLGELRAAGWRVDVGTLAVAVACGALYFAGLALSWTLLLRSMGGAARAVPLAAGVLVWTSTMLSRYVPGNIWHIVGRVAFAGRLGVARGQVVASATVEQLLTLLGALAVFGLSLPFWGGAPGGQAWLLLLVPVGLVLLHPRVMGAGLGVAARLLRRPELVWSYSYREMVLLVGVFTLANFASGLALLAVLAASAPLGPGEAALVIGAASLAWAVGYLSFLTPSGLGVREAVLVAILAQILPLPAAVAGSLVYRLALTLGEIVAAGGAMLYGRLRPSRPTAHRGEV